MEALIFLSRLAWTLAMLAASLYEVYLAFMLGRFGYRGLAVLAVISLVGTIYAGVIVWRNYV